MVVNTTVRVNDSANWVSVEGKKIGPRTEPWGTLYWSTAGCESVLPTLTSKRVRAVTDPLAILRRMSL